MKVLYDTLLPVAKDAYKRHGIVIIILFGGLYYFHLQVTKLEDRTKDCNEKLINQYANNNKELILALERSNSVIERNTTAIKKLLE